MKTTAKIEFGDFQTPLALARAVCDLLVAKGISADVVIEPTCGIGAFLQAAATCYPNAAIRGFDINPEYIEEARRSVSAASGHVQLRQCDFFAHDWNAELQGTKGDVIILGNLPWVTNQTISKLNGGNVPVKENFQGFRGMDARTGKSNFDISEWMLISLMKAMRGRRGTIAMLCKTATARKVLRYAWRFDGRIESSELYRIDAKAQFDAAVDACLFVARIGAQGASEAAIFANLHAPQPLRRIGMAGQDLVADINTYRHLKHLEGLCPYQWRSGVKHDCSVVMELQRDDTGIMRNKLGEAVDVEPEYLYPLLKCTDLAHNRSIPSRTVVVTQRRVGDDTRELEKHAPRLWKYLTSHSDRLDARKSSIYRGQSPFSLFGIGEYTFAPWKVAVSGLHRHPRFVLVRPYRNQPVLCDDTCYFLSFDEQRPAEVVANILNSPPCISFLESLVFDDAKRPITVDLLQRLNLSALADAAGLTAHWRAIQRGEYTANTGVSQLEMVMEGSQRRTPKRVPRETKYTLRKTTRVA